MILSSASVVYLVVVKQLVLWVDDCGVNWRPCLCFLIFENGGVALANSPVFVFLNKVSRRPKAESRAYEQAWYWLNTFTACICKIDWWSTTATLEVNMLVSVT